MCSNMVESYQNYLDMKKDLGANDGFEPIWMPDFLFDFQRYLVEWATRKGRAALFEDCGLGKTPQQLVWAENVYRKTGLPVLILAPLAVSIQTEREAEKFGIDCLVSKGEVKSNIVVTNYEKINKFEGKKFGGIVCDESSILKNFNGARKKEITNYMKRVKYRLLATATAAPNDYIELGTSSEALGYMGYIDMLTKYFKNDLSNVSTRRMYGEAPKWRLKGHAETPFWRWVTSWSMACRKPSDIGFSDDKFILPKLTTKEILVEAKTLKDGYFLPIHADNIFEQREEKKRTVMDRCGCVADIINNKKGQSISWCQLNAEAKALKSMINDSVEISGSDSDEKKTEAFIGFASGNIKRLITKPKIGALGMNWQNCSHMTYFPTHSYEQYYQSVRRCWRFGQKNSVEVDIVMTEGERKIMRNMERKNTQANKMFTNLVAEMNNSINNKKTDRYTNNVEVPSWV